MKIIGVIPARYASTRFPGKPLADICGKPMIWWVYQQCQKVELLDDVLIATDSEKIKQVCESYNLNVVMTSENCLTGTDRVAEVSTFVNADIFVNIQGDEPLIEPETIKQAIFPLLSDIDINITSLMTEIKDPLDIINPTICKAVTSEEGFAIYLTRSPAPYPKGSLNCTYMKALGLFAIRADALSFFREYGLNHGKAKNEAIEDIEMLRFIENGYKIKFVETNSKSVAVDTPKDLERVKQIIKTK